MVWIEISATLFDAEKIILVEWTLISILCACLLRDIGSLICRNHLLDMVWIEVGETLFEAEKITPVEWPLISIRFFCLLCL